MMADCEQLAERVQLIVPQVAVTVRMVRSRRAAAKTSFHLVGTIQFGWQSCMLAISADGYKHCTANTSSIVNSGNLTFFLHPYYL